MKSLAAVWRGVMVATMISAVALPSTLLADCKTEKEKQDDENFHLLIVNNFEVSQEFKPREDFKLCTVKVRIKGRVSAADRTITLEVRDSGNALLTSKNATIAGSAQEFHGWITFNHNDVNVTKDQLYKIKLLAAAADGLEWCLKYDRDVDPYPRGVATYGGVLPPILQNKKFDYRFKTYAWTEDEGYGAAPGGVIGLEGTGIVPGGTVTLAVQPPAAIDLSKGTTTVGVDLLSGVATVAIGSDVDGYSNFEITQVEGEFAPYSFGGVPIGTSTIGRYGPGGGSIEWATGDIAYFVPVVVRAAGFVPIVAAVHGSARLVSPPTSVELPLDGERLQPTRVELQLDGEGLQQVQIVIPAASALLLALLAAALLAVGVLVMRRLKRAT